jgi:DNA replication protein DnaD
LQDHPDGSYTIALGRVPGSPEIEATDLPTIDLGQDLALLHSTDGESANQTPNTANDAVSYILRQKAFSEEDLVRAITCMIPSQLLTPNFRQEVDYWFNTFDKEVIKELVRRTDEARQRDPELNCQAYIRKIANEWIQNQILNIEDLAASDKLYRETRSLIEEFGIERQKEITRTHWETISRWLHCESATDFALSIEVARFAIQSAIMRKSDGRPSLGYIEDNLIKPFKENKIKTVEEAREFLQRQRAEKPGNPTNDKAHKQAKPQNKWQAGIDFTRFREN